MAATNGNFGQQNQYGSATEQYPSTTAAAETSSSNTNGNSDLSKDEIGWYFVEQYYTTLSKSPEKLHLFYSKRSHMVFGQEAEVAPVSLGRSAIQERIKELDFQDCKVRVSNVDSQASDENIVIQVIGETSNKSAELKKFVQTFVLAQQPTGYFVLNDIFRYINEEPEEDAEAAAEQEDAAQPTSNEPLTEGVEMPAQPTTEEPTHGALDTEVVDQKLEETAEAAPTILQDAPATNGDGAVDATEVDKAEDAPVAATKPTEEAPAPEDVEKALEKEDSEEAEKPKDPVPSPAVTRQPSTTKPTPAQPAIPAKPMSWANRAAAAAAASAPRTAVPQAKAATPTPAQARAPSASLPAQPTTAAQSSPTSQQPAAPTNTKENESPQQGQGSGWQTAGNDHAKRQNRPQSVSGPIEKEGTMGYVRNVTEAVNTEELRAALASYGELVYFDINRSKNCAFVEYANIAGYQAAVAANPHQIGGETILVEPRRPKASAYGGAGYAPRGGMNGRGRGGFEQGRSGSQRGRGDFGANRGRGAPRGRGTSQTATS